MFLYFFYTYVYIKNNSFIFHLKDLQNNGIFITNRKNCDDECEEINNQNYFVNHEYLQNFNEEGINQGLFGINKK